MSTVVIDLTGQCNLNCLHCYASNYRKSHPSIEQLRHTIALLPKGVDIAFMGGEPLLRKELFELTELALKYQHTVSIVTNATLIDDSIALKLFKSGISKVQCSLDGPNSAINDKIRGNGSFEKAVDGILAVNNIFIKPDSLGIGFTVNSINYSTIKETCDFLSEKKVYASIFLEKTINVGSALLNQYLVPSDQQWIFACEQLCKNWRTWPTLAKATFLSYPKFIYWLESRYSIVLNEAIYRCPVVEGNVFGRIFPDGKLYSCGLRDLLDEAMEGEFLTDEGQDAIKVLQNANVQLWAYPSSKDLMNSAMRSLNYPVCDSCEFRNICSNCPVQNMLGDYPPPEICILINQSSQTANDFSNKLAPFLSHNSIESDLTINEKVYWKELRNGGILIFNPVNRMEIELDPDTASIWRDIICGNDTDSIKIKHKGMKTGMETSFFVESIIGGLENCGIIRDRRDFVDCN